MNESLVNFNMVVSQLVKETIRLVGGGGIGPVNQVSWETNHRTSNTKY